MTQQLSKSQFIRLSPDEQENILKEMWLRVSIMAILPVQQSAAQASNLEQQLTRKRLDRFRRVKPKVSQ